MGPIELESVVDFFFLTSMSSFLHVGIDFALHKKVFYNFTSNLLCFFIHFHTFISSFWSDFVF